MAEKLPLVLAEDSVEADDTSPCLACAHRVNLGCGRFGACVRLTSRSQVSCGHCKCMLGFAGCNGKPRRGGYVVPACRSCVSVLEGAVADLQHGGILSGGLPQALALIGESKPQDLTKMALWPLVRKFSGSCATADAIYDAEGKAGLAARVVSQIALKQRDAGVYSKLRAPLSQLLLKGRVSLTSSKGGHGAKGKDVERARSAPSWGDRTSLSVIVSGDAPLQHVEAATSSTVQRYRATKVESDGKSVDDRAVLLGATRSASTVEASLASRPLAKTRRSASARADAVQKHLLQDRKARAALQASRSPEEKARLAVEAEKAASRRRGITAASVSGATPKDGAAVIETTKKRREDRAATKRGRATKRRLDHQKATGKDHKTIAIDKERGRIEKIQASRKHSQEDPGSCKTIYCKTETCELYDVPRPYGGEASYVPCLKCRQGVRFA